MEIFIILLLILLNGLFAMSEIALISARKSNLTAQAKQGNKRARQALKLAEDPNKFLSTVQIGITLIGILTGIYSGAAIADDPAGSLRPLGSSLCGSRSADAHRDRGDLSDYRVRRVDSQAYRYDGRRAGRQTRGRPYEGAVGRRLPFRMAPFEEHRGHFPSVRAARYRQSRNGGRDQVDRAGRRRGRSCAGCRAEDRRPCLLVG